VIIASLFWTSVHLETLPTIVAMTYLDPKVDRRWNRESEEATKQPMEATNNRSIDSDLASLEEFRSIVVGIDVTLVGPITHVDVAGVHPFRSERSSRIGLSICAVSYPVVTAVRHGARDRGRPLSVGSGDREGFGVSGR